MNGDTDDLRDERRRIREALEASSDGDGGQVCTQWAVVAEFMGPDGSRTITRNAGMADDGPAVSWAVRGLFHAGLDTWAADDALPDADAGDA